MEALVTTECTSTHGCAKDPGISIVSINRMPGRISQEMTGAWRFVGSTALVPRAFQVCLAGMRRVAGFLRHDSAFAPSSTRRDH